MPFQIGMNVAWMQSIQFECCGCCALNSILCLLYIEMFLQRMSIQWLTMWEWRKMVMLWAAMVMLAGESLPLLSDFCILSLSPPLHRDEQIMNLLIGIASRQLFGLSTLRSLSVSRLIQVWRFAPTYFSHAHKIILRAPLIDFTSLSSVFEVHMRCFKHLPSR